MKLGKHDEPREPEKVKPDPPKQATEQRQPARDPWAEHCTRCGLLACRKGHT